jgi:GTPase SAR1 family protein
MFSHFKGAGGALVVYDVTKDKTFDSLNKWIEDLKEQANEDIVIFLVGNKLDLVEKNP